MSSAQAITRLATASGVPGRTYATVDELIKHRAEELKEFPLISYPREGLLDFEDHSAQALDAYADAAVVKLRRLGLDTVVCCWRI